MNERAFALAALGGFRGREAARAIVKDL